MTFLSVLNSMIEISYLKILIKNKHPNMLRKMNHLYTFMLNAEHHCRLDKYPFPGEPDDGNFPDFDDIWLGTQREQKSGNDYSTRMLILDGGFQRYMNMFYYKSVVRLIQTYMKFFG